MQPSNLPIIKRKGAHFFWVSHLIFQLAQIACVLQAEPIPDAFAEMVRMIETDDANCIVNDGKLVSLTLVDTETTLDVWVDRWFMEVQTADHTKQHLSAETPVAALGCSRTNAGAQRWTIHSIKSN